MLRLFSTLLLATGLCLVSPSEAAPPVEYVKICSLYGASFFYIPGMDTCFDLRTGETREQTAGGTWRSQVPSSPGDWVTSPAAGCPGGEVVQLATIGGDDLAYNNFGKYETDPFEVDLGPGDFIAKVMMTGGFARELDFKASGVLRFTGVDGTEVPAGTRVVRADATVYVTIETGTIGTFTPGEIEISAEAEVAGEGGVMATGTTLALSSPEDFDGNVTSITAANGFDAGDRIVGGASLCFSFRDFTSPSQGFGVLYAMLGCQQSGRVRSQPATWSFTPMRSVPPPEQTAPYYIVANEDNWGTTYTRTEGELSLALCVRNVNDTVPAPCSVADNQDGSATITCGATSVVIYDGVDGADGADGAMGDKGTDGMNGEGGTDGINGINGTNGSNGTNGINGTNGTNGRDGAAGADGTNGINGTNGTSCSVRDNANGSATITCGSASVTLTSGKDGEDGTSCSVSELGEGRKEIRCTDGRSVLVHDGADGTSCTVTSVGDGASLIACADGASATVVDGSDGRDGEDGLDGAAGRDGRDGQDGLDGQDGANGQGGANGRDGADGAPGYDGRDGVDGQSAGACTIVDHGDGSATMSCPDGTRVELLTMLSNQQARAAGGCAGTSQAGVLVALAGLAAMVGGRRKAIARHCNVD